VLLLIPNTLKLAYLLAQYLYANKRLDLPGIGSFLLDPSVIIDTENTKQRVVATPEGISFKNDPSVHDASDLVKYISSKSGKMKALAEADLESHLQLAQQFLNISKPFSFDGIGTLTKIRAGEYEFTQGNIITDKLKDGPQKDLHGMSKKESLEAKYQAYLKTPTPKTYWQKPTVVLLVIAGIALAIWGGYTISSNRNGSEIETSVAGINADTTVRVDSSQLIAAADSIKRANQHPDSYKYILEVANATRAQKRYKQLKPYWGDIQMETKDSVTYKLYFIRPVTNDTSWKKDSLTAWYGKKVYIDHQN
jgi:hypothetical protein